MKRTELGWSRVITVFVVDIHMIDFTTTVCVNRGITVIIIIVLIIFMNHIIIIIIIVIIYRGSAIIIC